MISLVHGRTSFFSNVPVRLSKCVFTCRRMARRVDSTFFWGLVRLMAASDTPVSPPTPLMKVLDQKLKKIVRVGPPGCVIEAQVSVVCFPTPVRPRHQAELRTDSADMLASLDALSTFYGPKVRARVREVSQYILPYHSLLARLRSPGEHAGESATVTQ